jgi:hypothetical protein
MCLEGLALSAVPALSLRLSSDGVASVVLSDDVASSSQTPAPLIKPGALFLIYSSMSWLVDGSCGLCMRFVLFGLPTSPRIAFLWHHRCWLAYRICRFLLPPRLVVLRPQCRADLRRKTSTTRPIHPCCYDNRASPGAVVHGFGLAFAASDRRVRL